jgi:hypothetical protein
MAMFDNVRVSLLPLIQSQFVSLSERGFQAAESIWSPFVRHVSILILKFRY